jgi:hypothetical protein
VQGNEQPPQPSRAQKKHKALANGPTSFTPCLPPSHTHADTHVRIRYNENLNKNVRRPHTQAHPEELGPQFFGTVQLAPEKQALHTHWPLEHLGKGGCTRHQACVLQRQNQGPQTPQQLQAGWLAVTDPEELGPQFFGVMQLGPVKQGSQMHWPLEHLVTRSVHS